MNEYHTKDMYIGQKEQFEYIITEEKMKMFYELSGDNNPLHMDEVYAQSLGYSGRVVNGMLTASLISKLGGEYLPGKFCLIQEVDAKFARPVFIGDSLIVIGEVVRIETELRYVEVKVTITNQNGQKVLRGLMKAAH